MEIPVYLFTGFLDAGKTTFIQQTLASGTFGENERVLLILCEEGVEEYDPTQFSGAEVYLEMLEDESELTLNTLLTLRERHDCDSVIIEYNGMWKLDTLYLNLPEGWVVYQEFMFADANTFLSYNRNMRALVVDKLQSCEIVVFNRDTGKLDREETFRIVRALNRRCDIAYEDLDGNPTYDDRPLPLPYDLDAPIVTINEDAYAIWFSDVNEQPDRNHGKTVRFTGCAVVSDNSPNRFIIGRELMTCCEEDIQFAGMVAEYRRAKELKTNCWYELTAILSIEPHPVYDNEEGPVLHVLAVKPTEPPKQPVATFY